MRHVAYLYDIPDDTLETLLHTGEVVTHRPETVIIRKGPVGKDDPLHFHIITDGRVSVRDGRRVIATLVKADTFGEWGISHQHGFRVAEPSRYVFGRTNYLGVAGDWRYGEGYHGVFYYKSKNTVEGIKDGSSNTLFFGEAAGGGNPFNPIGPDKIPNPNEWTGYSWASGADYVAFGLGTGQNGGANDWGVFSSFHANIVQFAYGDGSIRNLRDPAFYNTGGADGGFVVLQALGGIADGKVTSGVD